MKENKIKLTKEMVISILFIIIIFFTMISILLPTTQDISISIQKYVKDNSSISDKLNIKEVKKEAKSIKNLMEANSNEKLYGRIKYIEIYGMFNKIIDNYVINGENVTIRLNNGYLTEYREEESNKTNKYVESYSSFNDFLKERKIKLLYIQAPAKINKYDEQLPKGIKNYCNSDSDTLLQKLSDKGVDTFDLREVMNEKIDDYYGAFFKADHHWKPETGLWAAAQVAERLNEEYNFNFNMEKFEISNYDLKVYKNYFLGSQGRRVSLGYTNPEDISIITPKWDTDITIQCAKKEINQRGRFEEVLIDYSQLEKIDYYNKNPYAAYLWGDDELTKITNNLNPNGKKILMIKESFSLVMIPFLIDGVSEIDLIDKRYYRNSVKEYVEQTKPDIVMMMFNALYFGHNIN